MGKVSIKAENNNRTSH